MLIEAGTARSPLLVFRKLIEQVSPTPRLELLRVDALRIGRRGEIRSSATYLRAEVDGSTRVEHLLPVLLDSVRHERALIHWLNRGEPLWQQIVEWEWAQREFPC